jgi:hypothetical protein
MKGLVGAGLIPFIASLVLVQISEPIRALTLPRGFDFKAAMAQFGNYEESKHSLDYTIPASEKIDASEATFFKPGGIAIVHPYWVKQINDDGARKVIVLTYAVPGRMSSDGRVVSDPTFDCHACSPMVGAAFFVRSESGWKLESSRLLIGPMGEFAKPPTEIWQIKIGPRRTGVAVTGRLVSFGRAIAQRWLLVSWNGDVRVAFDRIVADNNSDSCGSVPQEPPCYANSTDLTWVSGKNRDFYDLVVTLHGTDSSGDKSQRAVPVRTSERMRFIDGAYRAIKIGGDSTSLDKPSVKQR